MFGFVDLFVNAKNIRKKINHLSKSRNSISSEEFQSLVKDFETEIDHLIGSVNEQFVIDTDISQLINQIKSSLEELKNV